MHSHTSNGRKNICVIRTGIKTYGGIENEANLHQSRHLLSLGYERLKRDRYHHMTLRPRALTRESPSSLPHQPLHLLSGENPSSS